VPELPAGDSGKDAGGVFIGKADFQPVRTIFRNYFVRPALMPLNSGVVNRF
jgi:hypothetical protein